MNQPIENMQQLQTTMIAVRTFEKALDSLQKSVVNDQLYEVYFMSVQAVLSDLKEQVNIYLDKLIDNEDMEDESE